MSLIEEDKNKRDNFTSAKTMLKIFVPKSFVRTLYMFLLANYLREVNYCVP